MTGAEARETEAAPAPAVAAHHLSPQGALAHPYRALLDASGLRQPDEGDR